MNAETKVRAANVPCSAQRNEEWRPALIAFYERDCAPHKAKMLRWGVEMDYLDQRTIAALQAALEVAP